MADSSSLDVNIVTNAVDSTGATVIGVVQSNVTESSTVDALITTGGIGATGATGAAGSQGPQGDPGPQGDQGPEGVVVDATTSVKGRLQLAGDIGGTSSLPIIKRTIRATVTRDSTRLADYACTGTSDDVQIQAAVDAVYAAGGGTVEILGGTNPYRIAATITVPENVTIRGERMARQSAGGVTLKTAPSVNLTDMIKVTGTANPTVNADLKHDVVFENITFDGNNTTTNNVKLTNQDTVKFQNCRLIQAVNSVVTVWDSSSDPIAATIPGGLYMNWCNVSSTGGTAIDLQFQTQCWISNCWFTGSSVDTWINFHASNKIHVTNCEFNGATQALKFSDTATITCNDITVEDSVFALSSGQKVITDNRTNAGSTRVTVSGTAASGVLYDKLVGGGSRAHLNDNLTPFNVLSQAAADKLFTLKGFASQSGRYIEAQNSAGTAIAYLNSGGNWYVNNGSTSAVSYGFTSEINSGMYRIGAGDIGWSLAGALSMELSSAGLDVKTRKILGVSDGTNATDAVNKGQLDLKQPLDTDLTTIAGLTATTDSFLQSKSSAWTTRTIAQVKTDLGLTGTNSGDQVISDATLATTDITTNNFTTAKHGFVPKGTNVGHYLKDDGTWAAIAGGGDALTSNPLSQFAATTSLQLKNTISDETGSGALVFGTSPALTTPTGIVKGDVGLGNVDNTSDSTKNSATATLSNKRITTRVVTTASTSTLTVDGNSTDLYTITAQAANLTIASPTGTLTQGQKLTIRVKDNGTARTITWNAIFRAIGVTLPSTTVISKTLYIAMMYNTTDTKWDVLAIGQEA